METKGRGSSCASTHDSPSADSRKSAYCQSAESVRPSLETVSPVAGVVRHPWVSGFAGRAERPLDQQFGEVSAPIENPKEQHAPAGDAETHAIGGGDDLAVLTHADSPQLRDDSTATRNERQSTNPLEDGRGPPWFS